MNHFLTNFLFLGELHQHLTKGLIFNRSCICRQNIYDILQLNHHLPQNRLIFTAALEYQTIGIRQLACICLSVCTLVHNQLLPDFCFGGTEDFLHAALLGNQTAINDGNSITDFLNDAHFMGDNHDGNAQSGVDIL